MAGDILCYEHLKVVHSTQNYSREFGRFVEAWQRQLPHLVCPLKFEDGHLLRRLSPESLGATSKWEEDVRIQAEERWVRIPEVLATADFDSMTVISAVVFLGVVGVKHKCRAMTEQEFLQATVELPTKEPTGFTFGQQRFNEILVEVMGA